MHLHLHLSISASAATASSAASELLPEHHQSTIIIAGASDNDDNHRKMMTMRMIMILFGAPESMCPLVLWLHPFYYLPPQKHVTSPPFSLLLFAMPNAHICHVKSHPKCYVKISLPTPPTPPPLCTGPCSSWNPFGNIFIKYAQSEVAIPWQFIKCIPIPPHLASDGRIAQIS